MQAPKSPLEFFSMCWCTNITNTRCASTESGGVDLIHFRSMIFKFHLFIISVLFAGNKKNGTPVENNKKRKERSSKVSVRHTDVSTWTAWGFHQMQLKHLLVAATCLWFHNRGGRMHTEIPAVVNLWNNTAVAGHVERKTEGWNYSRHVWSLR